jgi:NAD(P)-dependent dehydrogenase (short-subunit alcohol dehydrogenase family)
MRQAALELSAHGIRANAVAPGIVKAGMARHQLETEPAYAARVATAVPLGELQTPEQIGAAVAFLASPAAASMTGTVLLVDAGSTLGTLD